MKITKKKPVKETVKAKAKAVKQKVKGKVKGCTALVALAFAVASVSGCMTPEQASRSTHATYGDMEAEVETDIGEKAHNNTVSVTVRVNIGDGAMRALNDAGILFYGGVSGQADDAITALLGGALAYDPSIRCEQHDHECGDCGGDCSDCSDCAGCGHIG